MNHSRQINVKRFLKISPKICTNSFMAKIIIFHKLKVSVFCMGSLLCIKIKGYFTLVISNISWGWISFKGRLYECIFKLKLCLLIIAQLLNILITLALAFASCLYKTNINLLVVRSISDQSRSKDLSGSSAGWIFFR